MIRNLQKFLKYGLKQSISINADSKRFIQATSKDFFDFVNDGHIESNVPHFNNASIQLFQQETNGWKDLESRRYLKWIGEYAKFKQMKLIKDRDHRGRYFQLTEFDSVTNEGDIWDEINKQVK
jgi:hypothetical protein